MIQHSFDLERLHEMIYGLQAEIDANKYVDNEFPDLQEDKYIGWYEFQTLLDVLSTLFGGGVVYGTELPQAMGVRPELINRFYRKMENVPRIDAFKLADRTLIYLKSIENTFTFPDEPSPPIAPQPTIPPPPADPVNKGVTEFQGALWKAVPDKPDLQAKIGDLARIVEELIAVAKGSNLPEEHAALTAIERAQLIAILETALRLLGAPLAEKSLLKRAKGAAGQMVKRVAEKEAEEGMGHLAEAAEQGFMDVIMGIFGGG